LPEGDLALKFLELKFLELKFLEGDYRLCGLPAILRCNSAALAVSIRESQ
jgi:hypothetical protein